MGKFNIKLVELFVETPKPISEKVQPKLRMHQIKMKFAGIKPKYWYLKKLIRTLNTKLVD